MHYLTQLAQSRRITLCALCCALLFAAGCSDRRSEQARGEGDTLFSLGRVDEARAAYQRAAETNPENPMAQLGLARCAAKEGNTDSALALYETARGLDAALAESYMEPVKLLVEAERYDDALAIADTFAKTSPEKGGLIHSAVLLKAGRTPDAISELEGLRSQFPDSPEVQLNLGVAYSQGGKGDQAVTLLKSLAESASPMSSAAHMALIEVYQSQGKVAELLTEFEALAAAKPEDASIQVGYARVLLLAGKAEDAEAKARAILEKDPTSGWANYVVGAVKVSQGAFEESVAFLESAAAALPEEKAITGLLAQAKTGKAPAAPAETPAPLATAGSNESLTWRDLWKQAALKRLVSNRDTYLAEGGNEVREVLVLAALFTQNVELARELSSALPEDSKVGQFFKAMDSRDPKVVSAFFEQWKPEDAETLILRDNALGYAMASGAARAQALSLFLFCLERWPDNVVALYNIAQVFRSVRQPVIAAQQLQRLIVQYPENIDAHQMLYAALREGGAYDQARKAAEASYTLFPEERWSFLYLSQAYLDTGDPELALQVLNRASGMFEGDPELELAKGGIYARLGDCTQMKAVLEGISSTAPGIIANRANLLALCAMQADDWATVNTLADSADPALWPESLRLMKCLAALKADDIEGARSAFAAPAAAEGQPPVDKLALIFTSALGVAVEGLNDEEQAWAATLGADRELMTAYGTTLALQLSKLYDASWTSYEKLLAQRPPHIALAQLAFAALQLGDKIEGVREKGQAIADSVSTDPRAWIALAELLKKEGDTEGEARSMEKAIAAGPESAEAWSKYGAMQEKKQDYKGAADSYRKLVALEPESAAANNNLAYMLLMAGGSDEEALKFATLAQAKVPNNPGVLHTLGLAQMRTGDLEASKIALAKASEIDPANPTISFDYGRVLMKLGDKEKARERLRYALGISERAGLDFPERAEAESLLSELN